MATNYSVGHGMRRRSGTPSSYTESAGTSMARSHQTSDEAYSAAAAAGSVRIPIGAAVTHTGTAGTPVAKKNTQAADPTAGGKANRKNIEKVGATYRVQPKATYMQLDPAAGPTMANARIVPSVQGRVAPNFDAGIQASNA
jgi:hypothetical protein